MMMNNTIQEISLKELHPFKNHPFQVDDNEELRELARSIQENGVLTPAMVRPRVSGGYELISGHRRKSACEIAGLEVMPVIVRDLDDSEAVIIMVDSNQQREHLLPSEKAFAYKMKLDAIKKQGQRNDLTSAQVAPKLAAERIGDDSNISKDQVKRYIRLTHLIPQILQMVDDKVMAFGPAVKVSFLPKALQDILLEAMELYQCTPSLSQAMQLKAMNKAGNLDSGQIYEILSKAKGNQQDKVCISIDRLKQFFPKGYTPKQIKKSILKILEAWKEQQKSIKEIP